MVLANFNNEMTSKVLHEWLRFWFLMLSGFTVVGVVHQNHVLKSFGFWFPSLKSFAAYSNFLLSLLNGIAQRSISDRSVRF